VEYQVEDTGPGVPEAVAERLLKGFFSTKGSRGTGIGLMSVKKLMDEMGGEVRLESAPGAGARFSLRLPGSSLRPVPPARQACP
jgi:signal transduction histidine kinase